MPGSTLIPAAALDAAAPPSLVWAAAVEVPADATRTILLWYAAVALLGLVVLLLVTTVYGWRRRRR